MNEIANHIIDEGGKLWEKGEIKRVYMTCEVFNTITGREYNLNEDNNKLFYDFAKNAILRSYKGKRPTVEVQY